MFVFRAAVVGAGTMGGEIAHTIANAEIPVVLKDVRDAKKAGKSVDDVANSWKMPAKYTGYAAPQPARLKANVQVVYDELK